MSAGRSSDPRGSRIANKHSVHFICESKEGNLSFPNINAKENASNKSLNAI